MSTGQGQEPGHAAGGAELQQTYILWTDLETTGLDTVKDEILEAAVILTDTNLTELFRQGYVLQPTAEGWVRLHDNEFVRKMHQRSGLLSTIELAGEWGATPDQVQEYILFELANHTTGSNPIVHLGGSGIAAFDRPMIRQWMPALDSVLHYAPIDIGILRRTWKMWTGNNITTDEGVKKHRAMSDVRGHLAEARAFRAAFQSLASAGVAAQ